MKPDPVKPVQWDVDDPDILLVDADNLARLYGVSVRTVRRRCTPLYRYPPAGPGSVQAHYDAAAAADDLAGVAPRPERTAAAIRARLSGWPGMDERGQARADVPAPDPDVQPS